MIFCLGDGKYESKGEGYQKNNIAWNKDVSSDRFDKIQGVIQESGPKFDGCKKWETNWKDVSAKVWKKITAIPEFDEELTKKITGLSEIPTSNEVKITIEGEDIFISQESAKAFRKSLLENE